MKTLGPTSRVPSATISKGWAADSKYRTADAFDKATGTTARTLHGIDGAPTSRPTGCPSTSIMPSVRSSRSSLVPSLEHLFHGPWVTAAGSKPMPAGGVRGRSTRRWSQRPSRLAPSATASTMAPSGEEITNRALGRSDASRDDGVVQPISHHVQLGQDRHGRDRSGAALGLPTIRSARSPYAQSATSGQWPGTVALRPSERGAGCWACVGVVGVPIGIQEVAVPHQPGNCRNQCAVAVH